MLTVAYCRVSTEEQAAEGFSIEGQADKLRTYAALHELGEVMVLCDPGLSGKDMKRPALQRLLGMIEQGHVAHVLTWRLDRLSRNLADLILLADRCGQKGVALHSFSEKLDLSSATGRMFYNILGSFAQFYREQLSENVRMGMQQAARQGRWTNHAPTGYDLVDGVLIANSMADVIERIFRLRIEGLSYKRIAEATGVKYSTVQHILSNRAYLGEIPLDGAWLPGLHEPLVSAELFEAAHKGRIKGRGRGRDVLSGLVRCGLCTRAMTVDQRDDGRILYRCRHRGEGCTTPRRPSPVLTDAALLGLQLVGHDGELRQAIEWELDRTRSGATPAAPARVGRPRKAVDVDQLLDNRRKLLALHYADKIDPDHFHQAEQDINRQIEAAHELANTEQERTQAQVTISAQFERVRDLLATMDIPALWRAATPSEQRQLLDELLEGLTVYPDHIEVKIHGTPTLNVAISEVQRSRKGEINRVGGPT